MTGGLLVEVADSAGIADSAVRSGRTGAGAAL
ncbi:hypothetical protein ABIA39_005297 [Nocardia sp. GAS34]